MFSYFAALILNFNSGSRFGAKLILGPQNAIPKRSSFEPFKRQRCEGKHVVTKSIFLYFCLFSLLWRQCVCVYASLSLSHLSLLFLYPLLFRVYPFEVKKKVHLFFEVPSFLRIYSTHDYISDKSLKREINIKYKFESVFCKIFSFEFIYLIFNLLFIYFGFFPSMFTHCVVIKIGINTIISSFFCSSF